jgi:hypothetical protein
VRAVLLFILVVSFLQLKAQDYTREEQIAIELEEKPIEFEKKFSISLATGASLINRIYRPALGADAWVPPMLALLGDYQLNKILVIGGGLNYEIINYYDLSAPTTMGIDYRRVHRFNAGFRLLFNAITMDKSITYGGIRLGYTHTGYSQGFLLNGANVGLPSLSMRNSVTTQLLVGHKHFWNNTWGVVGEVGLGAPYFMVMGISYKLQ